jgi:hypothetical protein
MSGKKNNTHLETSCGFLLFQKRSKSVCSARLHYQLGRPIKRLCSTWPRRASPFGSFREKNNTLLETSCGFLLFQKRSKAFALEKRTIHIWRQAVDFFFSRKEAKAFALRGSIINLADQSKGCVRRGLAERPLLVLFGKRTIHFWRQAVDFFFSRKEAKAFALRGSIINLVDQSKGCVRRGLAERPLLVLFGKRTIHFWRQAVVQVYTYVFFNLGRALADL